MRTAAPVRIWFCTGKKLGIDVDWLVPLNLLWHMQKYFAAANTRVEYSASRSWNGTVTITPVPIEKLSNVEVCRTQPPIKLFGIELFTTIDADLHYEIQLLIAGAAKRDTLPAVFYIGEFSYYVGYMDDVGYIFTFDRRGQL